MTTTTAKYQVGDVRFLRPLVEPPLPTSLALRLWTPPMEKDQRCGDERVALLTALFCGEPLPDRWEAWAVPWSRTWRVITREDVDWTTSGIPRRRR